MLLMKQILDYPGKKRRGTETKTGCAEHILLGRSKCKIHEIYFAGYRVCL